MVCTAAVHEPPSQTFSHQTFSDSTDLLFVSMFLDSKLSLLRLIVICVRVLASELSLIQLIVINGHVWD